MIRNLFIREKPATQSCHLYSCYSNEEFTAHRGWTSCSVSISVSLSLTQIQRVTRLSDLLSRPQSSAPAGSSHFPGSMGKLRFNTQMRMLLPEIRALLKD